MKAYKKIGLGLASLIIFLGIFSLLAPQRASASTSNNADYQSCLNSTTFVSIAEIDCKLSDGTTTVQFIDKNPTDDSCSSFDCLNYVPYLNGSPDQSIFCNPGGFFGISVTNISGSLHQSDAGSKLTLLIDLGHTNSDTKCVDYSSSGNGDTEQISGDRTNGINNLLQFSSDGSSVTSLTDVTAGLNNENLAIDSANSSSTGTGTLYYTSGTPVSCNGEVLIVTVSGGQASANRYVLSNSSGGGIVSVTPLSQLPDLASYLTTLNAVNCAGAVSSSINFQSSVGSAGTPIGIAGTPPTASTIAGSAANASGGSANGDACAAASNSTLAWIMCPLLNAANDALFGSDGQHGLVGIFLGQLSFRVSDLGTTSGSNGQAKVEAVWALIRDISSAVIVIVMLIMVISQAISWGPFDAYTIRKILPKLAAAIILMQLSWFIGSWIVDRFDDIGNGIADLMYFPFGGPGNMTLSALLANANAGLGGDLTEVLVSFMGGVALVVLGVAALPMVLMVGFTAVLGIITGFVTLIFRKMLIIACLIFSPLAILAWVLPGTDTYWKFWKDNFLKSLMMFPLAVGLIALGRIFGYIVGTQDNGTFLNVIFIFVGYFGVLFILPKTFKWGGSVMSTASSYGSKMNAKLNERPKKYFQARQESLSAERARQSQERYQKGVGVGLNGSFKKGFGVPSLWRRPLDLAHSGQIDPLLLLGPARRRRQAMTAYSAKGHESELADVKAADEQEALLYSQTDNHDGLAQAFAEGNLDFRVATYDGKKGKDGEDRTLREILGTNEITWAQRQAGLNAVQKYGGDSNMQFLDRFIGDKADPNKNKGPHAEHERNMIKLFLEANVGTLQGKMKHLYYGAERDKSVSRYIGAMSENSFVGMEGVEMQAIIESLTRRADSGDVGAKAEMSRVLSFYTNAINNDNIRSNISSGVNRAVEAFVSGQNLDEINEGAFNPKTGRRSDDNGGPTGRAKFGLDPINRTLAADPALAHEVAELSGRISAVGTVSEPPKP